MAQERICSICLHTIDSDPWLLGCLHEFHGRCVKQLYRFMLNTIDEFTGNVMQAPCCPNCRHLIRSSHLPLSDRTLAAQEAEYLARQARAASDLVTPSHASMPVQDRPLRLVRENFLFNRERTLTLIDRLVARRREILARRATQPEQPELEQPEPEQPEPEQPEPEQLEPRERSEQPEQASFSSDSSTAFSPLLHPELQDIQIELGVLQRRVEETQVEPPSIRRLEDVELIEREGGRAEEEEEIGITPVEIFHHVGRGRHTRYLVAWSDDSRTIHPTRIIEARAGPLLLDYRRRCRARNTRLCRERKRARSSL